MTRHELIHNLSQQIATIQRPHPIRIAIDGVDNAGKTTLADELGQELRKSDRPVIRASIDGFHRPRHKRYRQGNLSPEGYFYDSFDLDVLKEKLLKPLGPAGDLCYATATFDFRRDMRVKMIMQKAEPDAVLLFDGVFLLRPELNASWDFRIFLQISFKTSLQRAQQRDIELFGSIEQIRKRYMNRYIPGQRIYLKTAQPESKADIVIDYNDPSNPKMLKGTGI